MYFCDLSLMFSEIPMRLLQTVVKHIRTRCHFHCGSSFTENSLIAVTSRSMSQKEDGPLYEFPKFLIEKLEETDLDHITIFSRALKYYLKTCWIPRGLCGRDSHMGEYADYSPRVNSSGALSKWLYLHVLRSCSQGV